MQSSSNPKTNGAFLPEFKSLDDIFQYLNENKDNVKKRDESGQNILHIAVKKFDSSASLSALSALMNKYPELMDQKDKMGQLPISEKETPLLWMVKQKIGACIKHHTEFTDEMVGDIGILFNKIQRRATDSLEPYTMRLDDNKILPLLVAKKASSRLAKGKKYDPIILSSFKEVSAINEWLNSVLKNQPKASIRIPILFGIRTHRTAAEIIVEDNKKYLIFFDGENRYRPGDIFDKNVLKEFNITTVPFDGVQSDAINCSLFSLNFLADIENLSPKDVIKQFTQSVDEKTPQHYNYQFFKNTQSPRKQENFLKDRDANQQINKDGKSILLKYYLQQEYHLQYNDGDILLTNTRITRKRNGYILEGVELYLHSPYTLADLNKDREFNAENLDRFAKNKPSDVIATLSSIPINKKREIFSAELAESKYDYLITYMSAYSSLMHAFNLETKNTSFEPFYHAIPISDKNELGKNKKIVEEELIPFLKNTVSAAKKETGFDLLLRHVKPSHLVKFIDLNKDAFVYLLSRDKYFSETFRQYCSDLESKNDKSSKNLNSILTKMKLLEDKNIKPTSPKK